MTVRARVRLSQASTYGLTSATSSPGHSEPPTAPKGAWRKVSGE
ncbi:hypothetical protein ACWD1Z_32265 [Streptomyces sp. NPDC002784]